MVESKHGKSNGVLDMDALIAPMLETHQSQVNYGFEWRRKNLSLLCDMIVNHKKEWVEALATDLKKHEVDTISNELFVLKEIQYMMKNLKNWMKPEHAPSPLHSVFSSCQVRRVPLRRPGVLIIGPSNYPVQLLLSPLAGSLAGGNPTVIKPSELCMATSRLMHRLVETYFDKGSVQVVEGGVPETTQLLKQEWGKIIFTGSERVGRIVAAAAAQTLTPAVLELGGKSPTYVDKDIHDLPRVARRIIWGKMLNCGQTCVAIDYLIVHKDVVEELVEWMLKALGEQFGEDHSTDLGWLVHDRHAKRQVDMLQEVEANPTTKILCGGSKACDLSRRFIAPTLVLHPPLLSRLMKEEIFGPILPIHVVSSKDEAIAFAQKMPPTPLALYVFTDNHDCYEEFLRAVPAATVSRNDSVLQVASKDMPLSGLGTSGNGGALHGKHSFETFTHPRPELWHFLLTDFGMLKFRPATAFKVKFMEQGLFSEGPDSLPHIKFRRFFVRVGIVFAVVIWSIHDPVVRQTLATVLEFLGTNLQSAAQQLR